MSASLLQPYQVMPPLACNDLASLTDSITRWGVLVPIEYDEQGKISSMATSAPASVRTWASPSGRVLCEWDLVSKKSEPMHVR